MREFKISFCTICMNRLHHLQQTLPVNLRDNEDYANLEFVLLDYNSTDGLDAFMYDNMREHIESGRVVYYRTFGPKFFHRSHSRNLAFKLAQGDLVCNIDADNYTGKSFASYINRKFQKNAALCLNTIGLHGDARKRDVLGRICMRKNDFLAVSGYDEYMEGYGFEDYDLVKRITLQGIQTALIKEKKYLSALTHHNQERLSQESTINNLYKVLISYVTPSVSDLLLLLKNNEFNSLAS